MFQKRFQFNQAEHIECDQSCKSHLSPVSTEGTILSFKNIENEERNIEKKFSNYESLGELVREQNIDAMEKDIFSWFEARNIYPGNPEDLIQKYSEQQKKKIQLMPINLCISKLSGDKKKAGSNNETRSLLLRRLLKSQI